MLTSWVILPAKIKNALYWLHSHLRTYKLHTQTKEVMPQVNAKKLNHFNFAFFQSKAVISWYTVVRRRDQDVDYFKWTQVCTQAALNGWSFCGFLLVDCECRGVWVSSPRLPAEWARTLPHQRSLFTPTTLPERSTSSTRSTSAISGTIVTSSTRPHCQAQHIPRSPKREVCVRKCWEERELCERSSSATAGTILSSLLHQSHLSDSAPSSIITSFLGVGGWNVQTKMRTFAF